MSIRYKWPDYTITLEETGSYKNLRSMWRGERGFTKLNFLLGRITQNPGSLYTGGTQSNLIVVDSELPITGYKASFKWINNTQLRIHSEPWEVAWCLFDYLDDVHFSYVIVKPNGLEIGRVNGVRDNQQFVYTSDHTWYVLKRTMTLDIARDGDNVTVTVKGKVVTGNGVVNYDVLEQTVVVIPFKYKDGVTSEVCDVALYTEDCEVNWLGVAVA